VAYWVNQDYWVEKTEETWSFMSETAGCFKNILSTHLHSSNIAAAIMAVQCLQARLPVTEAALRAGVSAAQLPGRQQKMTGAVTHWLDVAHNPHAMRLLSERLKAEKSLGKTIVVFSMLEDKDIKTSLARMKAVVDHWYAAPLNHPRAASLAVLKQAFEAAGITKVSYGSCVDESYTQARRSAAAGDRIVITGSFVLVAALTGQVQT
jgi:dihydrofolate synthase/folylpolyglutamate synthase